MGLCNRLLWKFLLLSPPVCTFSPEAAFLFIISQQQVRAFLFCCFWSTPADVQAFWSIHLFRDFLSGKALYSQPCLGGFQSHYKIIRILQSFIIIPWNFIPVIKKKRKKKRGILRQTSHSKQSSQWCKMQNISIKLFETGM